MDKCSNWGDCGKCGKCVNVIDVFDKVRIVLVFKNEVGVVCWY